MEDFVCETIEGTYSLIDSKFKILLFYHVVLDAVEKTNVKYNKSLEDYIADLQESAQEGSETCSLCNEPDLLFKPNGANLEPVVRLSCLHSFHLRCIIISLEKNMTYSRCQRLIYLDFNLLPVTNIETENSTTPDMVFVELHNKILVAERILKEKTLKVSHMEYEILDSYYSLREALEKKLAEFKSIHPGQPVKILL
ncbi:unnamed protein product [Rhizophagus irregularis]|nr:unnamed protein product [Rhizophagus irregularis]